MRKTGVVFFAALFLSALVVLSVGTRTGMAADNLLDNIGSSCLPLFIIIL